MATNIRKTGIDVIGDVRWGTHFCQFYQTKEDLTDILVPYFKTGLESNEFCMWITSKPVTVEEAKGAIKKEVPDFEQYLIRDQIEIIPHTEWYLKDGVFNLQRVLNGWVDKLNRALARGYEGMRITGNTAWLEKNDWRNFAHYEEEIDNVISKYKMMAICSYSLDTCGVYEIIDVVRNHQFALIKREGRLELFESSERRRAKEALRISEEKYRILYETIRDGIVATDMDGRILECNQAYVDMLGYSKDEITKLTYHQLTPEKWHQMEFGIVKELIIGRGYSDEYEKEYRKKDGMVFPISIKVWLMKDEYGKPKGMWGIVRDITERKHAEDELREQRDYLEYFTSQLTAANKELEAFSYSVSHDLRAPLRSINGFCKVLMEDYADKLDAQAKNYLQRVSASSACMGQLIEDLLNLSRITRREMCYKTVNLSAMVRSIANELQEMQPERKVEFIIANGLVTNGDSNLLRIAFKNLLSNAWKFTRNRQQARIEFGITPCNEKSAYFVRDNGVGFDMAYVNKLFGAFQRLHMTTEFEGTGIGLAIVQRIIHRHGGHIWAEGKVDKGAVFYFTI